MAGRGLTAERLPCPLSAPSYEFKELAEDLEALRSRNGSGLSLYPRPPSSFSSQLFPTDHQLGEWKARYPDLLENFNLFKSAADGKLVAVFLDYDGTLAPIVKDPDCAFMSGEMRETVRQLARLFPTAIISGRGREKVQDFVKLGELYYAGSHGLDIVGPKNGDGSEVLAFQPAAKYEPMMNEVHDKLVDSVSDIPGASVEHNKFCVSVHFRNCAEADWPHVQDRVESLLACYPDLHLSHGRKVLELKPKVDWDKGTALSHLLKALGLHDPESVLAIYIGDDRTDEDAFRQLATLATGFGILVSSKVKATEATYTLRDPSAVQEFLSRMVEWGSSQQNKWHSEQKCNGWQLHHAASARSLGALSQQQPQQQPARVSLPSAGGSGGDQQLLGSSSSPRALGGSNSCGQAASPRTGCNGLQSPTEKVARSPIGDSCAALKALKGCHASAVAPQRTETAVQQQ